MEVNLKYVGIVACIFAFSVHAQQTADSVPAQSLQEIVVTGQSARQRISDGHLGSENLELTRLALTPQMFGETDIIKSITLMPGIHGGAEGTGGFEVRGGNVYQNLISMDGMTLYNPSHLMGIFSTFNDDAMSQAILHKGPVPARFGGASSSVLETYMKPGNLNQYRFSGTIGILNAKATAEGPIVKDRLSFAVAARRSYVDLFLKLIPEYRSTVMNFFDVNAKIRYRPNKRGILDVSFFASRDNLAVSRLMDMRWGNLAGSINWNTGIGDNWRVYTTGAVTDYTSDMGTDIMDSKQKLRGYIRSFSANGRAVHTFSDSHSIEFGVRSELLRVKSGEMTVNGTRQLEIRSGWQNAVWIDYEGTFSSRVSLSVGVRLSSFSALSGRHFHEFLALNEAQPDFSSKTYMDIEPRGSIRFLINENHNIKAGASLTTQNLHGARATSTTFLYDRYALSSANIKPERTAQYSAGYAGMTPDGAWDWSVEGYFKSMRNVYDYRDGMSMFSRINLESLILGGKGRSYGMELMIRKNSGRLTGWISYTLSKTETRIPGINGGKWYDASNDRRNDIAVVAIYALGDRWKFSASWTYSSGRPLTAPDAKYELGGTTCYYYTARNSYKTPASHRLDLSATYTRVGKRVTSIWSFGVFNAYSHYSPFVIYFEDDSSKPSGTRAVQQSLFGIVPSVSYTIEF